MLLDEEGKPTCLKVGDVFRFHQGHPPSLDVLRGGHPMKQRDGLFISGNPDNVSVLVSLISEIFGVIFERTDLNEEFIDYSVVSIPEDPQ